MLSLLLRNLFFTILQPGVIAGLTPYFILGEKASNTFSHSLQMHQWLSSVLFISGLIILFDCIIRFAIDGKGTLSPADPTKKLVVKGLYQYTRNPMYIGVTLLLLGETLFFLSGALLAYTIIIFVAFNLFIVFVEEPRLHKDFKESYHEYCQSVPRWI